MNQDSSYHLFDGLDHPYCPSMADTALDGTSLYNTAYGHFPAMFPMNVNTGSLGYPNPLAAPNNGPFVIMHIDHYSSLMHRLEAPLEPNDPAIGHVPGPTTVVDNLVQTIHVPSRDVEAPSEGGLNTTPAAGTQVGNHPARKPHKMRSKVACSSCSNAHKTCDQGHPCGRCTKRGIAESCEYPSTKGGRRTRKTCGTPPDGEHHHGFMSSIAADIGRNHH